MKLRYEIKDGNHPTERGERFSTLERAMRYLAKCVPAHGRFYVYDRETKTIIAR